MQQARRGDTVHVHYTGSLEDGSIFDSSDGNDPIEFKIGSGEVIPGFEEAIVGMKTGDQKRETIGTERAYGARRTDLVFTVDRKDLGEGSDELAVGDVLGVGFSDGNNASAQVAALTEKTVTLDANHPLAGKTLVFDLELVSID